MTAARLHDRYPELGTGPIPVAPYIDPAYFALEKKYLFKNTWLHVGRVEELPKVGDYMLRNIPVLDSEIVIARARDKKLYAFHNVCSHRLNKIAYQPTGTTRKFFCKFHGWAYDLDGTLTGVPDEKSFMDLDKSCLGLTRVSVDTWNGFIFINANPAPDTSLKDFMEPVYAGFETYPFDKFTACYAWNAVVNCNWKVALDAFQETYHVNYLHGRSIAYALLKDEDGNLHPIDGICGDLHRRLSIAGDPDTVYGNPQAATAAAEQDVGVNQTGHRIAAKALKVAQGGTRHDLSGIKLPELLNWTKHPSWAFDINVVFPDFYLSCRPNYFQAYNFRPISHDKTLFEARVYYPEMVTAGGRFYQEYMKTALRDVLLEDLSTLETTQAAAATGAKQEMVIQDFELMVRHQAVAIDRLIEEGLRRDGQLQAAE
ncbi:SRPBCC family protein [Pararhodobacter aggregans]|uniref:3-phenylpropionate dioxygenase n=1 Tax=Pararhodobacter aggregans TaxID=404875 RepID=A0A2T7UK70_9RHOB|nr:aromatic ring-hydroxylating dioxygenase subunit alpha [Pararhodobacter aggregans]PTX03260.1 phenylpropionate dioxygenase-like ring-hydroxylating dioxygenase large terminal subunit [Pararhodobacter aggregans]PVE45064.1 3-phenylpropionate dioxygenase [Pararhodobacter aggregans]